MDDNLFDDIAYFGAKVFPDDQFRYEAEKKLKLRLESDRAAQRQVGREDSMPKHPNYAICMRCADNHYNITKRYAAVVEALEALLAAVKSEPAMNNMKYDQLGIQVNKALALSDLDKEVTKRGKDEA